MRRSLLRPAARLRAQAALKLAGLDLPKEAPMPDDNVVDLPEPQPPIVFRVGGEAAPIFELRFGDVDRNGRIWADVTVLTESGLHTARFWLDDRQIRELLGRVGSAFDRCVL